MALFGEDPRDRYISFLEKRVEFLEKELACIADASSAARNAVRAEPREPGPKRIPWRQKEDRPDMTTREAVQAGAQAAAATERAFDARQP